MKILQSVLIFSALIISLSAPALAVQETPVFPVCSNPQGELKVEYTSGIHGIPGDENAYSGSDKVYIVSENLVTQCLCPESGNGIQTNWWKVGEISEEEIEYYKNTGWIYVPDGSVWGLDEGPYFAHNFAYTCKDGGTGGPSDNGGRSSSGDIHTEGISTSNVLGLAGTGGSITLFTTGILGLLLMASGVILRPHEKR